MKLVKGQRWKCNNPNCIVEIIEQSDAYSSGTTLSAKIRIVQSISPIYSFGHTTTFCGFPATDDGDNNYLWQYLHGQDRPCDGDQ